MPPTAKDPSKPPVWPFYVGIFLSPLAGSGVIALLDAFQGTFHMDVARAGLTITAYMVPYAAFQLVSGTLSDVLGRGRTLVGGFLVFSVGSLAAAALPGFALHLAARAVQGAGGAFVNPVVIAVVGDLTGEADRGRHMGRLGVGVAAAVVLGPLVAGSVSVLLGWRAFFLLLALGGVASAVAYGFLLRHETPSDRQVADVVPLLRRGFAHPSVRALGMAGFLTFVAFIGLQSFASDAMAEAPLRFSDARIGLALSLGGSVGFIASPIAGRLVDTWGRVPSVLLGFGFLTAGSLALAGTGAAGPTFWTMTASIGLAAAGLYVLFAGFNALTVEVLPQHRGTAASIYNFLRFLGYSAAPLVLAPLYARAGLVLVGFGAGAVALVGGLVAWTLPETQGEGAPDRGVPQTP